MADTTTYVSTRNVPLEQLTPYPGNAKRGDVEAIRASLRRNGQYRALVVRQLEDGGLIVLAGNHTMQALAAEDHRKARCEIVRCDDDTARRINLADNRTAELGGYDEAALAELLGALEGDYDGSGWTADQVAELLADTTPPQAHTDPDDIPEPPAVPRTKPGDLWLLGPHRILCGDSTSHDDVARLMAGERARLMATDPPYLVDYDGSNHPQSTVNSAMTKDKAWDDYKDPKTGAAFFTDFIAAALAVALEARAPIYQWHADMRRGMLLEAWEKNGVLAHQTIIWVKSRPVLTRSDFMWAHEPCLYGWVQGDRPETKRRPPANESTVWPIDKQGADNDRHPTEKPVEIFARPLRWHTRPGELAYEPFSGSGSQLIAAHSEGRRCYAMEIAPQYVDVACRRYQEHTGVQPILEATGLPHDFTEPANS